MPVVVYQAVQVVHINHIKKQRQNARDINAKRNIIAKWLSKFERNTKIHFTYDLTRTAQNDM
eukprot:2590215-Amphidinium_carterae.1